MRDIHRTGRPAAERVGLPRGGAAAGCLAGRGMVSGTAGPRGRQPAARSRYGRWPARPAWRAVALVLVFLLIAALLGGCAAPGSSGVGGGSEQVLNDNIGSEPPTLDPALMTDLTSFQIANAVLEGLTRIGPNGVESGMAERWVISDDQLTYTFHLRDAVWQNGDPVTAHDFVYAWLRVLQPE
ncbi:MAG TPA: ABC transporter substrate-binding protein, partial [Thermaerobacter sp.]